MNKSVIEEASNKLNVVSEYLQALYNESLALVDRERQLDRNKEIILRKEGDVNNKITILNAEKSKLEIKADALLKDKQILDDKRKELELREKKFQEQLSILIKERTDVEGKLQELKVLIDRKADLDEREQEVVKKLQALAERESLVEKEKIIDRERKERLGGLEQELKRKSEKLQKMIDSA